LPVIAGLTVGIAFIVIMSNFPSLIAPTYIPHLGAGLQEAIFTTKDIPEVKALTERYPNTMIEFCMTSEDCEQSRILYYKEKFRQGDNATESITSRLAVAVEVSDDYNPVSINVFCGVSGHRSSGFSDSPANPEDYIKFIKTDDCVE
jgi:hypothetical protein